MKLSDAIKIQGSGVEIPDCSRNELPEFFSSLGFKVGAEIGVYKGQYTKKFADLGMKIYGVDIWEPYVGFDRPTDNRIARQKEIYKKAVKNLSPYKNVKIIKKMSMDAVNDFEDESLDFVYIDANHILKYAVEDITEWSRKVKKGGIVSGHDYVVPEEFSDRLRKWYRNNIHVKYAVDAYTKAYRIMDWYIIGRSEYIAGEERDRCRSWFWIKK